MVAFLVTVELHCVRHHLLLWNILKNQEVRMVFIVVIIRSGGSGLIIEKSLSTRMSTTHWRIHCSICYSCRSINRLGSRTGRHNSFTFIFKLFKFAKALAQLPLPFFLLDWTFTNCVHSFSIDKITGSRPSSKFTIDSLPMLFEIGLYML